MSFGEIVFALVMSGILGLWLYGIIITDGDTMRRIFWDNTAIGWVWREYFSKKKKAKQAPPHFTNQFGHQIPISVPPPAMPTSFNTSSLNVPHMNHTGKPLVIKNWDRLAGMATMVFGRRWIVVQAFYASSYEFTLQTGGMTKSVTFSIYGDMYDSHRVSVYCQGRTEIMDVGICKDPNRLLHEVTYTFNEKFR
jgi:hypothetical protein